MTIADLLHRAKKLASETMGAAFRLSPNENDWTLYITKTATSFKGDLHEVLELYIEEIESYRRTVTDRSHIKIKKPFIY